MKKIIKNANVITPYEIIEDGYVVLNQGKIQFIGKGNVEDEQKFDEVIDAEGNYLAPGFIDVHTHANTGHDIMDGTFEAFDAMADFLSTKGVTGFLGTTMTDDTEKTNNVIRTAVEYMKSQKNNKRNAQFLGLYLEGPYFSLAKKGAQPEKYIKDPDIEEIKKFIEISEDNIKILAIAPELKCAIETVKFLKEKGIRISAGHTNSSYEEAKTGINAGITQGTHLYNGMTNFTSREPGVVGALLTDRRVKCEMICDGIHLHKAAMEIAVGMKGTEGIILISDAMMATGLCDGEYSLGVQKVYVNNGKATLKEGNLAGSTLTLDRAVYNMIHIVEVPLKEAVQMATLNPAISAGVEKNKGSIEQGKDGDLVIFNKDIQVLKTIINGDIVFQL